MTAPGSVLSPYTGSMESGLVTASDRKCPLCWMDGAILISFREQAKYCVELPPSSSLMVEVVKKENYNSQRPPVSYNNKRE
ncbi:hypothetical protein INR49_006344 [Caranx melampygus]|nr:hypothetical protein INR49_006344 [Caranx melampygus]